jgi:hypothetical protein
MINLAVGLAVGFGLGAYPPAREYIFTTARRIYARFTKPKE